MVELNVSDIIERLRDLACYSPSLAMKMEHEEELPDEAVPFLIERLESTYLACEKATPANRIALAEELYFWLSKSYKFYLMRLARAENPWIFRFPKAGPQVHAGPLH